MGVTILGTVSTQKWPVFRREKPERSDKPVLMEGKILNMMFFIIYIP